MSINNGYGEKVAAKQKENEQVNLQLYVSNCTPQAMCAYTNVKNICEQRLRGKYTLRVIDIRKNPRAAIDEGIIATPALIRLFADPKRARKKVIGTLSDTTKVLAGIGEESVISGQSLHSARSRRSTVDR
ncbi:MAG: hypothetical protein LUQ40_02700 [Methanomicrobiales archaeon]|nr:hypothetical protein [Methanomicrobiales archaeon]